MDSRITKISIIIQLILKIIFLFSSKLLILIFFLGFFNFSYELTNIFLVYLIILFTLPLLLYVFTSVLSTETLLLLFTSLFLTASFLLLILVFERSYTVIMLEIISNNSVSYFDLTNQIENFINNNAIKYRINYLENFGIIENDKNIFSLTDLGNKFYNLISYIKEIFVIK